MFAKLGDLKCIIRYNENLRVPFVMSLAKTRFKVPNLKAIVSRNRLMVEQYVCISYHSIQGNMKLYGYSKQDVGDERMKRG